MGFVTSADLRSSAIIAAVAIAATNELDKGRNTGMEHLILSCLESKLEENGSLYGQFLLGPFPIGQGTTVATALRRTLLSELQGVAITAVEIDGAAHQYSSIVGVRESTLDITLNLKQVVLTGAAANEMPAIGYTHVFGPKRVCASDLRLPNGIHCVNKDQHIATVSSDGALTMKFVISTGKNYIVHHSAPAQTLKPSLFRPKVRNLTKPWSSRKGSQLQLSDQPEVPVTMVDEGPRHTRHLGNRPVLVSGAVDDIVAYSKERRFVRITSMRGIGKNLGNGSKGPKVGASYPVGKELMAQTGSADKPLNGERSTPNKIWDGGSQEPGVGGHGPLQLPPVVMGKAGNGALLTTFGEAQPQEDGAGGPPDGGLRLDSRGPGSWSNLSRSLLPIDAVFMPVNKVNFLLQTDDQWQEPKERIVLELWTNGSVSPRQALHEAATCLVYMFSLFRQSQEMQSLLSPLIYSSSNTKKDENRRYRGVSREWDETEVTRARRNNLVRQRGPINKQSDQIRWDLRRNRIDLGNLHLSVEAYAALKQLKIHTLADLLSCSPDFLDKATGDRKVLSLEISEKIKEFKT
jgi:DNA-directed RNA polymerase alpha subunit